MIKFLKEGITFGAIRNEALGIYVGAIERDEGKKKNDLLSKPVFKFSGVTNAYQ